MPYDNWEDKSPLFSSLYWYSIQDLVKYLHDLKRYIIHTPAKYSENHVPKFPKTAPPAKLDQRFPSHKSYICEGIGKWNMNFDLLELSSYVMIYPNRLERNYPGFKTPGEAEIYAISKINDLLEMIHECQVQKGQQDEYHHYHHHAKKLLLFSQQDFEEFYDLNWVEEQEKEKQEHDQYINTYHNNHHQENEKVVKK